MGWAGFIISLSLQLRKLRRKLWSEAGEWLLQGWCRHHWIPLEQSGNEVRAYELTKAKELLSQWVGAFSKAISWVYRRELGLGDSLEIEHFWAIPLLPRNHFRSCLGPAWICLLKPTTISFAGRRAKNLHPQLWDRSRTLPVSLKEECQSSSNAMLTSHSSKQPQQRELEVGTCPSSSLLGGFLIEFEWNLMHDGQIEACFPLKVTIASFSSLLHAHLFG